MRVGTAKTHSGRESNYSRQCGAITLSNPKRLFPLPIMSVVFHMLPVADSFGDWSDPGKAVVYWNQYGGRDFGFNSRFVIIFL